MSRVYDKPLSLFRNVRIYTVHLLRLVRTLTAVFQTVQSRDGLYRVGQEVYVIGPRGTDTTPYKIHGLLGNGQYKLSRDGRVEHRVYAEENLQPRL